jgi:hypothetical protein
MKNKTIKPLFLTKLGQCGTELDTFIARFMDIKRNIGNGVGAGKFFENLFADFVNQKMDGVYGIHLNLSNSSFIWDIIITDDPKASEKVSTITSIIKNGVDVEVSISEVLGDNWMGISLKTYKEDACQITTDYSYRTYLEGLFSEGEVAGDQINEFFSMLNKHDTDRYVIMALNTYDRKLSKLNEIEKEKNALVRLKNDDKIKVKQALVAKLESELDSVVNQYTFRLLSFDKKFDKITYKKNTKLSQYDLSIGGVNYFKVLYGKNQANPFQRGIWTHNSKSIEYFKEIKTGEYGDVSYFKDQILSTIFK